MNDLPKTWADVEQLHRNGAFCPEAWISLSSTTDGRWRMCCYSDKVGGDINSHAPVDSMTAPDRLAIQQQMLHGIRPSACHRCHLMEDQGVKSRRDRMMTNWSLSQDGTRDSILQAIQTGEVHYLDRIDIKFTGNMCNLKCFTCNPGNSSALGTEAKQMGVKPPEFNPLIDPFSQMTVEMNQTFWDQLRMLLPKTRILNFTGGEPFMMKSYWDMLDLAIETGAAEQMELHLSSNVSIMKWSGKMVDDYFRRFKAVRLQASIDGFGPWNNYIRYPSDFDTLISNVQYIRDLSPNTTPIVSSVVGALSVRSIPALNQYLRERDLRHTFHNIQYVPTYQRLEWLPMSVKQFYLDTIYTGTDQFDSIKTVLGKSENLDNHRRLLQQCQALDKHRGTDARLLWPEFHWGLV